MQSILKEPVVDQGRRIEIRSRWSSTPTPAAELQHLGLPLLQQSRLLHIEGVSGQLEPHQLATLLDPLLEEVYVLRSAEALEALCVDVFCRPGVTDAEGEMAALALGFAGVPGVRCHAGTRYRFAFPVPADARSQVERLLGNPLIHQFIWRDEAETAQLHRDDGRSAPPSVSTIELEGKDDEALLTISRQCNLALDLEEMRAIASYFAGLSRAPTDVELQSVALTWSEHCSHKTFKATIDFRHDGRREIIAGLFQTCIATPTAELNRPWVRSAFVDNAGVIAFDGEHDLAFKVETHNHPSALEPYGGAHTGVGGVIRDVLAVSAEPIANTDVLCFGPPDLADSAVPPGVFHPRTTYRGVVRGIADYGNNMGIPTIGGAVLFHPGYTANPLVYCGTLGIAPRGSHPRDPHPGDAVVLLGGRTGRDGLHGATMSSSSLDRDSVAGSTVQIGAPITEKTVRDVLPRLRDERLYHAITDCGAGGLCSAVGEMGADLGVEVDLARVPLKYEGLHPWEIWLSEAQERMVLAVPPDSLPRLFQLCRAYDVEATVLGHFRGDGQLQIRYGSRIVADMAMSFLHGGRPAPVREARWDTPSAVARPSIDRRGGEPADPGAMLLTLLAHPNIASKEHVIRRYDHEVQAGSVVKPLVGLAGPADAAVLQPLPRSCRGVVVAHGINPLYGIPDPHAMAMLAVDEALRNLVAVGGSIDRAALLDNFCWGNVDDPTELGALVRAAQGCRDAALAYRVPFISGKDSLRNTSLDDNGQHSIPGTLLISAVGVVPDVRQTTSMDLKGAGSSVYLLGCTADEMGGSHYLQSRGIEGGAVPCARPDESRRVMQRLTRAIRRGLVLSCHDLSEGGLAVAAAEMAIAGGLGMEIELDRMPSETDATAARLFAESAGRFLVEVAPERKAEFEQLVGGLPHAEIGKTAMEPRLLVRRSGASVLSLSVEELEAAWRGERDIEPKDQRLSGLLSRDEPPGTRCPGGSVTPRPPVGQGPRVRGKVLAMVLAAAGVNCDGETLEACRLAGSEVELVHLNQLLSGERRLQDFSLLVLPGGFSYGDHLGAGAMLATVLRYRLLDDLQRFVANGRPVLGVCNGFQVLARLGLLGDVALAANQSGRFECRWVPLRVEDSACVFLEGLEALELPIAHGQGRVVMGGIQRVPGTEALTVRAQLQATPTESSALARSCAPLRYVENPNGSMDDVAGVCNPQGNVFGLMPHPERYAHRYQHPDWQRRRSLPPPGLVLFQNAVRYVREAL